VSHPPPSTHTHTHSHTHTHTLTFPLSTLCLHTPSPHSSTETSHRFTAKACDWSFNQFFSLAELNDPASGWVVDDTVILKVDIVLQVIPRNEK
jgi:hypothetical protein